MRSVVIIQTPFVFGRRMVVFVAADCVAVAPASFPVEPEIIG